MTRFVIYGAGAIGGTIGARLFKSGADVTLICRGEHLEAIRSDGLVFRTPSGSQRLRLPVLADPREVPWTGDEVVFLCMKTQDTADALADLEAAAGPAVPVICAQNGVENERLASRRFRHVYAMLVALPATHLRPGEIIASGDPLSGCLHAGRYPFGTDPLIERVCQALEVSRFRSQPSHDVMALKYRKLLLNLGNALDVILGRSTWGSDGEVGLVLERLRAEGEACYRAAGIAYVSPGEYADRVTRHYRSVPVEGEQRNGSSTLQSVLRGRRTTEVDYLNGEIVLLGTQYGVATPANRLVRELASQIAAAGKGPGTMSAKDVLRLIAEADSATSGSTSPIERAQ